MPIHPYFSLSGDEARGLLFGLLEANKIQLANDPSLPSMRQLIQEGKIQYDQYDPREHWQSYRELVDQIKENGVGYGDCEDLAVAVAAEDQMRSGISSLPYAYSPRPGLFHVVTAVPSGQFGSISIGSDWPLARGAPPLDGYEFQDPSAAAGMGRSHLTGSASSGPSFGYDPGAGGRLPDERLQDSRVFDRRTVDRRTGGRGAPLGSVLGSFRQGLLGHGSMQDVARQIGEGARSGSGLQEGWAKSVGEGIPSALGLSRETPSARPQRPSGSSDPEDPPQEDDDSDEYGLSIAPDPSVVTGSYEWWLEGASDQVADDLFGSLLEDDLEDDEEEDDPSDHEDFRALASFGTLQISEGFRMPGGVLTDDLGFLDEEL